MAFLFGVVKGAEIIKREQKKNRARNAMIAAPGTTTHAGDRDTLTIEPDWWDSGSAAVIAPKLENEVEQEVPSVETLAMEDVDVASGEKSASDDEGEPWTEEKRVPVAAQTITPTTTTSNRGKRHRPPRIPEAPAGSFSAAELQRAQSRISDEGKSASVQPRPTRIQSSPVVISSATNTGSYFEQLQRENRARTVLDQPDSDTSSGELRHARTVPRPRPQSTEPSATRGAVHSRGSFAEALSQNRTRPKSSAPAVKVMPTPAQPRLRRDVEHLPAAGSFLAATTAKRSNSGDDNEAGSWEEFISSVSQDHKHRPRSGR